MENHLPYAVRAGDRVRVGLRRGDALQRLEDGRTMPGVSLECPAQLLFDPLQLSAHTLRPP